MADTPLCSEKLDTKTVRKFVADAWKGKGCRCRYAKLADAATTWQDYFNNYMADLRLTKNPEGFNKKCEPYISSPEGASRGLVVLQHGYSACAGFWYLLAPRLVAEGWTVMVPNMVGHGRSPKVVLDQTDLEHAMNTTPNQYTVTDYTEDFPESGSEYVAYANEIIKIVQRYKAANPDKEVSLVGISLGGAVATHMAMQAPELWDRVTLMNPFLAPPTALGADYGLSFLKRIVPKILPAFSIIRGDMISWGAACDKKRWPGQSGGHGGICQFTLKNFRAVLDFANEVEGEARARAAKLGVFTGGVIDRTLGVASAAAQQVWQVFNRTESHTPRANMKVQLLTSSNDGAISNARVHFTAAALRQELAPGNFGYCVMREEFSHVYISPVDSVGRDHWWLDPQRVVGGKTAIDLLDNFISNGVLVPEGQDVVEDDDFIQGDPRCDIQQVARAAATSDVS